MEVTRIGEHTLPVVPQRHARLRHMLSAADFESIMTGSYSHEAYRILGVLIPALPEQVPEWEWDGYVSAEAQEAGEYVEELDKSPTTDEIIGAFEKAFMVSGAGRLGKLIGLIQTGQKMVETTASQAAEPTLSSVGSPGGNGESG